uniref:Uncharacterized protein n=1 Tax=Amphimedon queenslandica TaxID=400682 RepID=A0A1X7VK18_AMPQE
MCDVLKNGFSPVWNEVNDLIKRPQMKFDDTNYDLKFIFGGDYEFLLLILGFNATHAKFSCIYCIKKDKRFDTTIPNTKLHKQEHCINHYLR